ncbi:hypothetical protein [Pseudoalteromonas denitrificans]|uniref:Porin n=1 Tax=Pseudoalteromonas denitrificans DSM 6059 TaxID=1123010 RepID=A0A1I1EX93_9GAMM|nr:hypothetical protein [Pseudoalteromonas denitrificans]SFB89523.1 hypothetical protein SAMN02745724_00399 [Pseudoalteromonas denitrificans DSM 6059]
MKIKNTAYFYLTFFILALLLSIKLNAQEVQFSGFTRLVTGASINDKTPYEEHHGDFSFKPDSLIGLQLDVPINKTFSATAQILGTRDKHKNSGLEWLYLSYTPNASTNIKLGQLRTSFFTYSDVLDVGFAYHWIKPPEEVYASFFFSHFDGINLQHHIVNKTFTTKIEAFYGKFNDEVSFSDQTFTPDVENFTGLVLTTEFNALSIRAAYSQANVSIKDDNLMPLITTLHQLNQSTAAQALLIDDKMKYYQLSINYDAFDYFIKTEWLSLKHDLHLIGEGTSYYISTGYQLNDYTFHLTYADRDDNFSRKLPSLSLPSTPSLKPLISTYNGIQAELIEADQNSWSLGVRWDLKSDLALKAELKRTHYSFTHNNVNVLMLALDWVF